MGVLLASLVASCSKASPGHSSSASSSTVPSGAVPVATAPLPPSAPPPPPIVRSEGMPGSFAPLARRADPAVATVKARVERQQQPGGRRRTVAEGLGTAFVYDPEGFLLTNNHVIEGATDILVSFVDGRDIKATVIGRDKHTDVAVLKVEERGLPSLPLGDSDTIEVGDWVVAIGNPFGLSHTVSAGILSAKGRTRDDVKGLDPSGYFNFLQTDASINPGNSGGPLLNLKGEVVGINAAVRANANNIGFAIPINMVRQLLPMLLRDGKIRRSQVGVIVDVLNSIEAGRLKRPDRKGAWVKTVVAGGPADRAGIAPDDVIIGFEGKTISDPNELRWMASIAGVNKVVTLRVARLERVFDVRLTLGELPELSDEADEP
ncbi:trypsin-like peptidase domain-containing protein [Sorangium sp. So ce1504]|uniref:S1C family serine protease n=2 Tax=unclassified Sorangium TaxID=2621164 RepID=UPI003F60EEE1